MKKGKVKEEDVPHEIRSIVNILNECTDTSDEQVEILVNVVVNLCLSAGKGENESITRGLFGSFIVSVDGIITDYFEGKENE